MQFPPNKYSITLIGMAGAGKSFIGKNLAKLIDFEFIDGDHLIIEKYGSLQELLDSKGEQEFGKIETEMILNLGDMTNIIFSPGGSVAYWPEAMEFLQKNSVIIYLYDSFEHIFSRVKNLETRGIVGLKNKTFGELYEERDLLYKKYADITIDMSPMQTDDKAAKAKEVTDKISEVIDKL